MFLFKNKEENTVRYKFNEELVEERLYNEFYDSLDLTGEYMYQIILPIDTKNTYTDIELLEPFVEGEGIETVFDTINMTNTIGGKNYLLEILKAPHKNIDLLINSQNICKKLIKNKSLLEELKRDYKELKEYEKAVLWCLKEKTNEEKMILDYVFFKNKYLKRFNKNEKVLTYYNFFKIIFTPIYGVLSPILFFIGPYIYLRYITGLDIKFFEYFGLFKLSFIDGLSLNNLGKTLGSKLFNRAVITKILSTLLSFLIYIQNLINNIDTAKRTNDIISEIHIKLNKLSKYLELSYSILNKTKEIFNFGEEDVTHCIPKLYNKLFKTEPKFISNKGLVLTTFYELPKCSLLKNVIKNLSKIDYYLGNCILINSENYSYSNFIKESKVPSIKLEGLWHPCIRNCVKNNIILDNNSNIILTGPNAGGKSTFIKAVIINIILSQTLGISPCDNIEITPYTMINTYLNIPDCKGKESLFEAEMNRALDHIKDLDKLEDNEFSFFIMDEIFSGTNPKEGISGGYAVCEKLGQYKNSNNIITTHFNELTKLEKTSNYTSYKMPIVRDSNNKINYTYKIELGESKQFIALELLKERGLDENLIERAIKVCNNIFLKNEEVEAEVEAEDEVEEEVETELETELETEIESEVEAEVEEEAEAVVEVEAEVKGKLGEKLGIIEEDYNFKYN